MSAESARPGQNTCPECGSLLESSRGETHCRDCGLVVEDEQIRHGRDWRAYTAAERSKRKRSQNTTVRRHDKGLGGARVYGWTDGYDELLSAERQDFLRRLVETGRREAIPDSEKTLAHGIQNIKRIHSSLGITDYIDHSCRLLRKSRGQGLMVSTSIEAIAGAVVYATCRVMGLPYRLRDVSKLSRVDEDRIYTQYKQILQTFSLEAELQLPSDFVRRFSSELPAKDAVDKHIAERLCEIADFHPRFQGVRPSTVVSAAIYLASSDVSQTTICEVCDVHPTRLRETRDRFVEVIDTPESVITERSEPPREARGHVS